MIAFESPQLEGRQRVRPPLAAERSLACEYNFTNTCPWGRAYPQKIARLDNRLPGRIHGSLGPEDLRRAKLPCRPDLLPEKFTAREVGA